MKYTIKLNILSIVILFSLISSIVFPTSVLADDTTPPPAETSEVSPPIQEPVTTEEPPATSDVLPPTQEAVTTEEPLVVDASPVPAATDEPLTADLIPSALPVMETQVAQESATSETAAPEPEKVDLSEVVSAAADNDVILADPSGDPLVLSTVAAAETLSTGDPYIDRGGIRHRFLADCTGQPINATNTCTVSSTPIQAAINFALAGETVFVLSGTYYENLVINTKNLTLQGDPGNLTQAGVGPNAPILDGNFAGATAVGITVYAEGFTLRGFVLQNFSTALWQQTVSGNNTITYDNNVFRNNVDGIKIVKDGGSPGIQIHYNVFENNSGYDLINVDPFGHNIQDINAMNNYWGCSQGPVVAFPNPVEEDYILWADRNGNGGSITPYVHENNDWPGCAILYGDATLYDHGQYKPYK